MMDLKERRLLLADDDADDCRFFKEALEDLREPAQLHTVSNGIQLMQYLNQGINLPHLVFLDINMPGQSGMDCLLAIKADPGLKHIPVIIFTTSLDHALAMQLYQTGAHYYVRKPGGFAELKSVISKVLLLTNNGMTAQPSMVNFLINSY